MRGGNGNGNKGRKKYRDVFDMDSDEDVYGRSPTSGYMNESYASSSMRDVDPIREVVLRPRNPQQTRYVEMLMSAKPSIVIATGAAGSGKTLLACSVAMKRLLEGNIQKIVITRPIVSVDEDIGFLPGDINAKLGPWLRPITDVFFKYISPGKFESLMAKQIIEICPLAMMRGRSFEDTFVLIDEAQNVTVSQMLMLLTRIGKGSKMVLTGDPMQHDRGYEDNGLRDLLMRLNQLEVMPEEMGVVHFNEQHIERHPVLREILSMYKVKYPPTH